MNTNVLAIYVDKNPAFYIINVAVKTGEKTFKSFYARQESISEYCIDNIIRNGKPHQEGFAVSMFPLIAAEYTFDKSPSDFDVKLNEKIDLLSAKYERFKDCLNYLTITVPAEQKLVTEAHDILREMRDELAQSYKG